ncbi:MAG: host attachment protein [Kofleriaceae bacterium]
MKRACIAIVDAAHARLYTYEQDEDTGPTLRELRDLVSPGRQAHGMFSDVQYQKPGVGPGSGRPNHFQHGGHGPADDHRTDHLAELDARFARSIVDEVDRIVREHAYGHLVLVASPKMLGALRKAYAPLVRPDVEVAEIPQDLAWLTPAQLHDHLAAMKLISPRQRITLERGVRPR